MHRAATLRWQQQRQEASAAHSLRDIVRKALVVLYPNREETAKLTTSFFQGAI